MKKKTTKLVNRTLINLGIDNVLLTEQPIFHWDGEKITNDESNEVKVLSTVRLSEGRTLLDFLLFNEENYIVLRPYPDMSLINDKNEIRVFISPKK